MDFYLDFEFAPSRFRDFERRFLNRYLSARPEKGKPSKNERYGRSGRRGEEGMPGEGTSIRRSETVM
jgi:hypothetical protein